MVGEHSSVWAYLNVFYVFLVMYATRYEAVADFLATDSEKEDSKWIAKKVGMKERSRKDV
jgi:hypothetical protein